MFESAEKLIKEATMASKYFQFVSKIKEKMLSEKAKWNLDLEHWEAKHLVQSMLNFEESCKKVPNNTTLRNQANARLLILKEAGNADVQSQIHIFKTVLNYWIKKRAKAGMVPPRKQAKLVPFSKVKSMVTLMLLQKSTSPYRSFLHQLRILLLCLAFHHGGRVGDYLQLRLSEVTHMSDDLILWRQRRSKSVPMGEDGLQCSFIRNDMDPIMCPVRAFQRFFKNVPEKKLGDETMLGSYPDKPEKLVTTAAIANGWKAFGQKVGLPKNWVTAHSAKRSTLNWSLAADTPKHLLVSQGQWKSDAVLNTYLRNQDLQENSGIQKGSRLNCVEKDKMTDFSRIGL